MYEILSQLELKPGHYNLRFALHSGSLGRSGSVYQEVDIPDFRKDALSLSGVVMSVAPALPGRRVLSLAGAGRAHHVPASSARRSGRESACVSGRPQVDSNVVLTTEVVDDKNVAVHTTEQTLQSEPFGSTRTADCRFTLPLERLPPAYLLRLTARAGKRARCVRPVLLRPPFRPNDERLPPSPLRPAAGDRAQHVEHDRDRSVHHHPDSDVGARGAAGHARLARGGARHDPRRPGVERARRRDAGLRRQLRLSPRGVRPRALRPAWSRSCSSGSSS